MLTITATAATALTNARSDKGVPGDYGVRFYTKKPDGSDKSRLAFKFVEFPHGEDTVIKDTAIKAYVAPEVDQVMGDIVVDTKEVGEEVALVLRRPATQS